MRRSNTWASKFVMGVAVWMSLGLFVSPALAQVKRELDPTLKPYEANGTKLSGQVFIGSSETAKKLVDLWAERFRARHPDVKTVISEVLGTEAAQAVQKGVYPIPEGAKLVALSYPLSSEKIQEIKALMGVEPIQVAAALDAIVLMVNHKNPLKGLTLDQVAAIFSEPSGQAKAPEQWGQVGVEGKLAAAPLNLYGRDDTSGTFAAFREMALKGAQQRKNVHAEPGSMSVVIEVGTDEAGIGYGAAGYAGRSNKVQVVPLARKQGDKFVRPTAETVLSGEYPLVRSIYMYAIPESNGQLDPIVKHFLAHVLSRDGQALAYEEGFFSLPSSQAEQAMRRIESSSIKAASTELTSQRGEK